jgi:hypothetical protein
MRRAEVEKIGAVNQYNTAGVKLGVIAPSLSAHCNTGTQGRGTGGISWRNTAL